jgi:hypothetical protein
MTMLRTLKRRFGIAAPRVAVRSQVPWYLRWIVIALAGGVLVAVAWYTYDFGRSLGGFHSSKAAAEQSRLESEVTRLQDENAALRNQLAAAERQMQIEVSTQGNLASQLKNLSDETALLKEDLAFFQTLMTSGGSDAGTGITINRFRVRPDALPGEYRYQLLIVQSRSRSKEFQGRLQLVVDLVQDGVPQVVLLPREAEKSDPYSLSFKFYHRVEGAFTVPPDAKVTRVQVRVLENGVDVPRASQSVNLS